MYCIKKVPSCILTFPSDTLIGMLGTRALIFILSGIVVLLGLTVGILLYQAHKAQSTQKPSSSKASISGTFDVNGVIPEASTITLTQKVVGTQNAQIFASNLPAVDQSPWSFNTATSGKTYQIQAQVMVNGNVTATSNILTVTAPAKDEVLTLDLTSSVNTPGAVISGNILVDGYIPEGSTITIKGRKLGAQTFSTVTSSLPALSHQFMSYATALSGVTYEVEGVLLDKTGKTIGTSNILAVTAPAVNEELTINSSAVPSVTPTPPPTPTTATANNPSQGNSTPAPGTVSVSGGINLNGPAPANSRIVILASALNANNYSVVVNNISPIDGATWTWNSAQNATWYTLLAVLKQHNANGTDTDIATSAPINVAAPASSLIFTLNSGMRLAAPGGPATVTCQTYNGGPNQNNWNVVVNLGAVSGAQSYWVQIGTNGGGTNTFNGAQQTNGTTMQTVNTMFNNSTTYYVQYAYANVPSTPLASSQWSGFSSATPLQCSH